MITRIQLTRLQKLFSPPGHVLVSSEFCRRIKLNKARFSGILNEIFIPTEKEMKKIQKGLEETATIVKTNSILLDQLDRSYNL